MSVLVPDIIIVNTLNDVLSIIRNNHNAAVSAGQEERSLLYILFNALGLGKYNYYDNVKNLLITTPQNPKHLDVKLEYGHNSSDPTTSIYVALSADSDRNNSLNLGEGDNDELVFENTAGQNEYIKQYSRRFQTTYQVIIVGENKNQVSVLYNLLRAMIIACQNHFALSGLSNLKIGGQDIRLTTSTPDRIFSRALTLNFEYEVVAPEIFIQEIFTKIRVVTKVDISDFNTSDSDSD